MLCVSARWYLSGTALTAMTSPRTIHDCGGFPHELLEGQYPAPGELDLVRRVRDLLHPLDVRAEDSWGLDHGTWSVLCHVYPEAGVPVVQLCIDEKQPPAIHYELGRQAIEPFECAVRFETSLRDRVLQGDYAALTDYESLGRDAKLPVPTSDHYLSLLYVVGASVEGEPATFPIEGVDARRPEVQASRPAAA